MKSFFLLILLFVSGVAGAQAPEWIWTKVLQGGTSSQPGGVAFDPAGNVYAAGWFLGDSIKVGNAILKNPVAGKSEGFLFKCNTKGQMIWARAVGGIGQDMITSLAADKSGSVYITGTFTSPSIALDSITVTNTFIPTYGGFVAKYDSSGSVLWAKAILAAGSTHCVRTDDSGNVYVTTGLGAMKVDHAGTVIWEDSSSLCITRSIVPDSFGNAYVTGTFRIPYVVFGSDTVFRNSSIQNDDIFLIKRDREGKVLWATGFGGDEHEAPLSIVNAANGSVYLSGYFRSALLVIGSDTLRNFAPYIQNCFVAKLDSSGGRLWAKAPVTMGGTSWAASWPDGEGGTVIGGTFEGKSVLLDSINLLNMDTSTSLWVGDILLARYNSVGKVLWATRAGGVNAEAISGIVINRAGAIFCVGAFINRTILGRDTVTLNPYSNFFVSKVGIQKRLSQNFTDTLCEHDSIGLTSSFPRGDYSWSSGDNSESVYVNDTGWTVCSSYAEDTVWIDSFHVARQDRQPLFLPVDTLFCRDTFSYVLDASNPAYHLYTWSTLDSVPIITVHDTGSYVIHAANGVCSVSDTVHVGYYPLPVFDRLHDTTICRGNAVVLHPDVPGYNRYGWSTGDTVQFIAVADSGVYVMKASNGICSVVDSVLVGVYSNPPLQLVQDTVVCDGMVVALDAGHSAYRNWHWSTGENVPRIVIGRTGVYKVTATDSNNCTISQTVHVTTMPLPHIGLPRDTLVCLRELKQILLSAPEGYVSYNWWPTNETTPTIYANVARLYAVEVTDANGCRNIDTTAIDEECRLRAWIPTAFTPNGDGLNDEFKPRLVHADFAEMHIYNRWGEEIFSVKDALQKGWDGQARSTFCQPGVYVYIINATSIEGVPQTFKGTVTLLK